MAGTVKADASSPFERLTTSAGMTHQPGLDGLRGIAVFVIVLFHLGVERLRGGYLSVTLFFTLSGVLIGTLVIDEMTRTGGFSLRRFWMRRARRLLPASLVTLAVVGTARHLTSTLADTSGADIASAALDVANWHFVLARESYADLFGGPSAVLHFWSLSIEEQFYLGGGVLVALLALARPSRPVRVIAIGACVLAAGSFALPFVTNFSIDRIYYGTDTRAGELMVGVAIAALIASARRRATIVRAAPVFAVLAAVAACVLVGLWVTQHPGTERLRHGLLPLTTLLASLVIFGALIPSGPVAAVTRIRPLGWLGRVSYSWYLVHWPIIVIANQLTTDRSWRRTIVLIVVTLAIAQVVALLIERPVRLRRLPARRLAGITIATLTVLGTTVALDGRQSASADLLARLTAAADTGDGDSSTPVATSSDSSGRPRVALFGDSVAFSMLLSLGAAQTPAVFDRAPSETDIGCGIALSPWPPSEDPYRCDLPAERYFQRARGQDVTAAIMISCQWELISQRVPFGDDDTVRTIGDPVMDDFVYAAFSHVADRLRDAGVERVLWMRCPHLSQTVGVDGLIPALLASRDPARVDALNAIIERLAADRGDVDVLRMDDWVNARVDDAAIRPDGSHFEYEHPTEATEVFVAMVNSMLA